MSTAIEPSKAQLIPSTEMKGLELALGELRNEAAVLPELKAKADALTVTTPNQYAEAGALLTQVRSVKKAGAFKINPFLEIAKRVSDFLRNERTEHENKCLAIDETISYKMSDFKRREREAAEAEERKINEERRRAAAKEFEEKLKEAAVQAAEERKKREKEIAEAQKSGEVKKREAERLKKEAAEQEARAKRQAEEDARIAAANVQDVKVLPSTPKVAGIRGRVNWKFRFVDPNRIPRCYMMPDEVKIGQMVRAEKDKKRAEGICPGIEVYSEDAV